MSKQKIQICNCLHIFSAYTELNGDVGDMVVVIIISLICQVGSNKRKIQIKYKIQNKQTTIKNRACKHTDETQ